MTCLLWWKRNMGGSYCMGERRLNGSAGAAAATKKRWWNVTVVKQILSSHCIPLGGFGLFFLLACGKKELTELCMHFTYKTSLQHRTLSPLRYVNQDASTQSTGLSFFLSFACIFFFNFTSRYVKHQTNKRGNFPLQSLMNLAPHLTSYEEWQTVHGDDLSQLNNKQR